MSIYNSQYFCPYVCFELINFIFHIFPLLIPEISASFTSYIVQIESRCINSLKHSHLNNILKFSSYLQENMLYLCYKNQSADILEKKFILRKNVTHEVILQTKF